MSSDDLKAIGEKTHLSLKSATLICIGAIIPLTWFLGDLRNGINELKEMHKNESARIDRHDEKIDNHERRLWVLERPTAEKK